MNLGDCWRHPGIAAPDGLVPFHKLSQWLSYSLIEPLEDAGIRVTDIDALTGLPEYRNGGLFLDLGVIRLADPEDAAREHAPGSPLVVGWRALTVTLLDAIAPLVRDRLGVDRRGLPAGPGAGGRHLVGRPAPGCGTPRRWRPAAVASPAMAHCSECQGLKGQAPCGKSMSSAIRWCSTSCPSCAAPNAPPRASAGC